jgi:hypothetical protein
MTFLFPAALFGLLGLVVIFLLGFLRIRPAKLVVPSLAIWKLIPEKQPPLREMKKPRFSAQLFLQAAAFALGILAVAQPFLQYFQDEPKHVVVALDASPRMLTRHADGKTSFDKAREQVHRLAKDLSSDDVVHILFRQSELIRIEKRPHRVQLESLAAGAAGSFDEVVMRAAETQAQYPGAPLFIVTDRPPESAWPGTLVLVGSPDARNIGIVDARTDGFLRLVNTGPARDIQIQIDGVERRVDVPSGSSALLIGKPIREARIAEPDSLPEDNLVQASDLPGLGELRVSVVGKPLKPSMMRALQSIPGVKLVPSGGDVRFISGLEVDWAKEKNAFVLLPLVDSFEVREVRFRNHPLLDTGLPLSQIEPRQAQTVNGGTTLLTDQNDRPIAAVMETADSVTLALGFDPYSDHSMDKLTWLPILMARYFESVGVRQASANVPRFIRAGDEVSLGPRGPFRPATIGSHSVEKRILRAAVLDERQSMNRGAWNVPASYALERKSRQKATPYALDLPLLIAAAVFLALAFALDYRARG